VGASNPQRPAPRFSAPVSGAAVNDRVVVFDVMGTLFDLAPVRQRLTRLGAPAGALQAWFGRMLNSAAALTLVDEFHPFREIGGTTLLTTLAQLEVESERADEVLQALGQLDTYPDASQALDLLEEAGVPAVTLTNGGRQHTEALLESAGLRSRVQLVLTCRPSRSPSSQRTAGTSSARSPPDCPPSGSIGWSGGGRSQRSSPPRRAIRRCGRAGACGVGVRPARSPYDDGHQKAPKLKAPVCAPTAGPTR
jgi:2-haloacid dehalogenase